MKKRKFTLSLKHFGFIALAGILSYTLFFIAPSNVYIIAFFSLAVSVFVAFFASFFVQKADQIIIALFVFLLLMTNHLAGFNILNTVLLVSFIVGLKLLSIKK